jgi:dipeptidyl-peptidase-4
MQVFIAWMPSRLWLKSLDTLLTEPSQAIDFRWLFLCPLKSRLSYFYPPNQYMRKQILPLLSLLLFSGQLLAQTKSITLEDIYKKGTFRGEFVPVVFDTTRKEAELRLDGVTDVTGKPFGQPESSVASPADGKFYLLRKGTESIYRRSSKSWIYLYDTVSRKLSRLAEEKVLHPSFSPDGSRIAYVMNNNLYVYEVQSGTTKALTTDGVWNKIINGNCDWVYEEEFEFTQAYAWSPKGSFLAYYRFDESKVPEYNMTIFDNGYNKDYRYKYPKAGDVNSTVQILIHDFTQNKVAKAQFSEGDVYIPRIKWTQQDSNLVVFWMNRHQNHLQLLSTSATTGQSKVLYEERNKYFVEINDDWQFLKNGKQLLFTSEKDGMRRLYVLQMDNGQLTPLSRPDAEVAEINAVNEAGKQVFYTLAWPRPMDRNLFVSDFSGKKSAALTTDSAWHRVELNDDFTQFFDFRSTINEPNVVTVRKISLDKKKGWKTSLIRTVSESAKLRTKLAEYGFGQSAFLRIPNSKGDTLNGWMLKPSNFDPSKNYPVLFCNYSGPGSQQVANRWGAVSPWHQMMSQKGFIIVSVDNTGTGYRGEEFKKKTYLQLGKFEIEDQIDAALELGKLPYVDKSRIGHWGWSYGGFMSSLAITKGADVFSAAVAVAPVTNWRYYDNIYTERYMRTPQENPKGYDDNSPINFTNRIKGKYLIIHGTADDNVHFQNATQMITSLVKSNIDFESMYYPNKNHGISGGMDNTTMHLWRNMTQWIEKNLGGQIASPSVEVVVAVPKDTLCLLTGKGFQLPDSTSVFLIKNGDQSPSQEVKTMGGVFAFTIPMEDANLYFLQVGSQNRPIELFLQPGTVSVEPSVGKPNEYEVNGSPAHLDFQSFIKRFLPIVQQTNQWASIINTTQNPAQRDSLMALYQTSQTNMQLLIDSIIDANPNSPVAPFILSATYGFSQDPIVLERRYKKLSLACQQSTIGKQLLTMIEDSKVGAVGSMAMEFTQDDVNGNPVSLSSFRGKYVLLDFWASWCGPCRSENPNVVENYQRFKDKNFTVLGVSLDRPGQKNRWLEAIQEDKLTWTHVSDLQFWNNAVAKQYKVQSIPQNLLIDPNGVIIAKNLRGEALGQKLCEVLGCN